MVSFCLYYRSFSLNLLMLHCCNLFWIRVIVIIVLFQCKGGGLGEELVESADYPDVFGSFVFVELRWISEHLLHY